MEINVPQQFLLHDGKGKAELYVWEIFLELNFWVFLIWIWKKKSHAKEKVLRWTII